MGLFPQRPCCTSRRRQTGHGALRHVQDRKTPDPCVLCSGKCGPALCTASRIARACACRRFTHEHGWTLGHTPTLALRYAREHLADAAVVGQAKQRVRLVERWLAAQPDLEAFRVPMDHPQRRPHAGHTIPHTHMHTTRHNAACTGRTKRSRAGETAPWAWWWTYRSMFRCTSDT